ncbi:MAG: glycosyltransferase family 2 protein [Candidatus Aenigmatarchaeota archaeon]
MISVVVPFYNEGSSAKESLKKINDFLAINKVRLGRYEIVAVDDGSSDNTAAVIRSAKRKICTIRLVEHGINKGVGAALRTGLKAANGDLVITTDSDLTYAPEDILKLLEKMEETDADIVIGTPFAKGGDDSEVPMLRKILSKAANKLDGVIFGLNFSTPTCIFRVWKKKAAKSVKIKFDRFEGVSESAIDAKMRGFKIVEVGVKYRAKKGRKSKMNIINTIKRHMMFIYTMRTGRR